MPNSKTQICNQALSDIGGRVQIVDFDTDTSPAAVQCRLWYDTLRQALLQAAPWSFARKTAPLETLAFLSDTPMPDNMYPWRVKYRYPEDCLRLNYILPPPPFLDNTGITSPPNVSSGPITNSPWGMPSRSLRFLPAFDEYAVSSSEFIMEAKENYSPSLASQFASNVFPQYAAADGSAMGLSYDGVRRNIMYTAAIHETVSPFVNNTGYTLWDGKVSVAPGDEIPIGLSTYVFDFYICEKNIDSGKVTFHSCYSPTKLVPAGIGGGDGTWRRYVSDVNDDGANIPALTNPHNGDFWMLANCCELYQFRKQDRYALSISPLQPQRGDAFNNVLPIAITEPWVYAVEPYLTVRPTEFDQLYLVPSEFTTAEITADYKLIYATYDMPVRSRFFESGGPWTGVSTYRTTVDADGNLYLYSMFIVDARDFKLYKFTPPTSIPSPGSPVGGSWADITPWSSSTGPNTDAAEYTSFGYELFGESYYNILWMLRPHNQVACISKFFAGDSEIIDPTPNDTFFTLTYVDLDANTFDYRGKFVTGYMKADWTSTTDPMEAAYLLLDCREANPYLDTADYDYPETYTDRWLFFKVKVMTAGVESVDTFQVMVQYRLAYGSPPEILNFIPETGWDDNYADYGTDIATPYVIEGSMQRAFIGGGDTFAQQQPIQDSAVYDAATNVIWWSGANSHMFDLNAKFSNRNIAAEDYASPPYPPFLKLSVNLTPSTIEREIVLSNVCDAWGVYVKDVTDPKLFSASFSLALTAMLSYKLVMPITGNAGMKSGFRQIVEDAVALARVKDGNEAHPHNDHTPDWIATRQLGWATGSAFTGFGLGEWYSGWTDITWGE